MINTADTRRKSSNIHRDMMRAEEKKPVRILIRTKHVTMKEMQKAAMFGMKNQRKGAVSSTDDLAVDGLILGSWSYR